MKLKRKIYRYLNKNRHIVQLLKNVIMICLVVLAGAIAVLAVEYKNSHSVIKDFFDAIWWSLVTITTVGYGDLVPVTFWGRIIGIIFIFLGFTIFSIFTAFIASGFIDKKIKERKGLNKITEKNHILICGWNNSAKKILDYISRLDPAEIPNIALVNELDEGDFSTLQNHYPDLQIKFIIGDFTNQEILLKANIKDAKHIILLFDESKTNSTPSDERTIIAAHNITYMKLKGKISIQLHDEKYLSNIRREKISNVVIYDNLGGNLLGNSTINPAIPDFIQEVLKSTDGKGFKEIQIPSVFINKPFEELSLFLREERDLIVLGIVSVLPEVSIEEIISDDSSSIDQFIKSQFEQSGKKFKTNKAKNRVKLKPENDYIIQDKDRAIVL
ncbi:MAG: NAD-binding protein [Candidatus Cloacimonetes bacterium]|nr:NAD-binding protein [Candidatus Cloacimonadota bacterium]